MKKKKTYNFITGVLFITIFTAWTFLVRLADVRPVGVNGTDIGLSKINVSFFNMTGVHMGIYTITDWLGLVPIFICMGFGCLGLVQLIKRRSIIKVDTDIILLGIYYILVIAGYLVFEMIPINYRPVLIEGFMEASYPSSTTLLVLSVMPTLSYQINNRVKNIIIRRVVNSFVMLFSAFMVTGRLFAGVHWVTDIIGSVLLSSGLFLIYRGSVELLKRRYLREEV